MIAGVAVAVLSGGEGDAEDPVAGTVFPTATRLETQPVDMVARGDRVFLANGTAGTVTEVDPATNTIRKNIRVTPDSGDGKPFPTTVAYEPEGQTLWIDAFTDAVVRYDAANSRKVVNVTVPSDVEERPIAADETAAWLLYPKKGQLIKVDAKTNEASEPIKVGTTSGNGRAISVAAGDGFAYVLRVNGEVVFVNAATGELVSGEPTKVGEQGGRDRVRRRHALRDHARRRRGRVRADQRAVRRGVGPAPARQWRQPGRRRQRQPLGDLSARRGRQALNAEDGQQIGAPIALDAPPQLVVGGRRRGVRRERGQAPDAHEDRAVGLTAAAGSATAPAGSATGPARSAPGASAGDQPGPCSM